MAFSSGLSLSAKNRKSKINNLYSSQIAEEGERHVNVEPSTSSRISAEVLNRPTTISTVTSRTPQLSIAAPTTTSYTVTPSGDVVHESLAAVLDKMQSATRAMVKSSCSSLSVVADTNTFYVNLL